MDYLLLIKEYRLLRGMTQKELAEKSNLNQSYISQLENNHPNAKSPTLRIMSKISKALNICPHILIRYDIPCDYDCFDTCNKKIFE